MDRPYTFSERLADGLIHAVGILAGLIASTSMLITAVTTLPASLSVGLMVYAVSMLAMFGFSAAYNLLDIPNWKDRLRRLDQAAIFAKIAGTYTPFALAKIGGVGGYGLLIGVWTLALCGIVGKLILAHRLQRTTIMLYLALGWAGIIAILAMLDTIGTASLVFLVTGGILYSVGIIFHVWASLPYQNAIWHLFVLAATASHFLAIVWAVF